MNNMKVVLAMEGFKMIIIPQRVFILFVLSMFLIISTISLLRAEKLVMPSEKVIEASSQSSFPASFTYVDDMKEVEGKVGRAVPTMSYQPNDYVLYGISVKENQQEITVRQTFINHDEGRIIYEQTPLKGSIEYIAEGYDEEKMLQYNGESIKVLYKNQGIYKLTWESGPFAYSITSLQPFPLEEWKKMLGGVE